MRSLSALGWLVRKEWRELMAARAFWVMLAAMGPLTGVSFISAAHTYAEVSGMNGTSAGVGEALQPLIGIWAPTFSACELAALFLLPFVAIRVVGGDRQSGALKLELQQSVPAVVRVAAKALVLLAGWLMAMLAPASAVVLWAAAGGSVYAPEILVAGAGHVLNAGIAIAIAAAAASLTEHPSTAAIATLAVTTGTWIVEFFAAVRGGWWERAAEFTPAAMVSEFQHGLVRLNVIWAALVVTAAGLGFSAIWMRLGVPVRRRALWSVALLSGAAVLMLAGAGLRANGDWSESRANSFSVADERALQSIKGRLRIEAHLAQADPRRTDLERRAFQKLRRVVRDLEIRYVAATSIGLFEQTGEHYGEIVYEAGGKREVSRATTEESVLESVYAVTGLAPQAVAGETEFRGHPLAKEPTGAAMWFYGVWPLLVGLGLLGKLRNRRSASGL